MKALVYEGAQRMRVLEIDEPQLGPGDLLIRVAAVGVCGSDLGLVRHGVPAIAPPLVLGHEFGGWREDNGEFVVVNPMLSCGQCAVCRDGRTHLCAERKVLGFRRQGGYAERVAVPADNVVPGPGLTATQAALAEPIANGVHAWRRAGRPTQRVAIIGAGSVGLCLLYVLRTQGVRDITVVDVVPGRLAHAMALGASRVAGALEADGMYEAVFDAAGTRDTRAAAVAATMPGGSVALIGLHDDELHLSAGALVVGDKTLCGCFAYTRDEFAEAVRLAGGIPTSWVRSVPIEQAEQAYDELVRGVGSPLHGKTQFHFGALHA
ncbi:zinc-binding dehydrogenase [Variovorax sp. Sphag1AA]|uniref:zinc-dependent alcohol dehydrogenase n=1 Tax=Variovorax sp. Sphag1AA TaxID=2587027 RepID=UPI0016204567|nr:alcohol dehydrogenase catalytic domain-containing protein [Variovorax sp. Sphag1AA]MBB3181339.1 threonine dehydrogenase-like Zn-dependent dehydrogenase [Variovorax sp. Sphag1AA]